MMMHNNLSMVSKDTNNPLLVILLNEDQHSCSFWDWRVTQSTISTGALEFDFFSDTWFDEETVTFSKLLKLYTF